MIYKIFRIVFVVTVLGIGLGKIGWDQQSWLASPKTALAQTDSSGLAVTVTGPDVVQVDDTFQVSVVATNIPDPGIFGYQVTFSWDNAFFSPLAVTTNPDFPILIRDELGTSTYEIAASREGDVPDLTGPVTLLTIEFQAHTAPAADALFYLADVKFGRRGGLAVPVTEVTDLTTAVIDVTMGDITGNVVVEGRAANNQAGHTVTNGAGLSTTTDADGNFSLQAVEAGTYSFRARSPGFLTATCQNVQHTGDGPTLLNGVVLLAGDINGDEVIDIIDAAAMGNAFGSLSSTETSDLNKDGAVDVLDLVLMAANFHQTAGDNPWLCQ